MLHKMLQTIDRYRMLEPQQRVVVGFSGGADSTALLFALHRLEQQLDIRVEACHINHCLRGEESERDQQFCTDFCKRYNIPLTVHRIWAQQEAKQAGQSVETFSRQRRYQLLTALAGQEGRVATAHNLNDNAETVLFYLARGTGLNGLGGIPPVRGQIIRPLIACTREQIEQFCGENGLDFIHDSSNDSDRYTRNRIRHHLLPQMQQLNDGFLQNIAELCDTARADQQFLQQLTQQEYRRLQRSQQPIALERQVFLQLHPAMQRRVLRFCCNRCSSSRPMSGVSRMLARIEQGSGRTELTKGTMLQVDADTITLLTQVFYSSERQPFFEQPFGEGKIPLFAGKWVRVQLCSLEDYKFFFKKEPALFKKAVDCDKMKDNAVFRQRKEGDRIALAHQSGSRPLKKLWNEAKTPQQQRWRSAVLSDSDGVVWVEGFGADRRGAAGRRQQNGCVDMGRGGNQMKKMQDDILKVLLSQQEIADKVCEIGKQITKDYEGKNLLMVSVLKGSVVFMRT